MAPVTLDMANLPVEKKPLDTPNLDEIAKVLNAKLCDDFVEACAEVVDCPDLTQAPFNLAAKGLGGNESILDIGGPAYLLPLVNREKVYDVRSVPKVVGDEKSFVVGAGAGPWPLVNTNCEFVLNAVVDSQKVLVPASRIAKLDDGKVNVMIAPADETRFCLLMNIYSSRGEPGKVLKIRCKKRTGKNADFINTVKEKLSSAFPGKVFGFGGAFVILKGKAKLHVMPDFSTEPLKTDDDLNKWLTFHEMSAPLTTVGTFVTKDPEFDLRVQHFHSFGEGNQAGHYHYDTTPDDVEYLAYFSPGKMLYRVDRPPLHLGFGAD